VQFDSTDHDCPKEPPHQNEQQIPQGHQTVHLSMAFKKRSKAPKSRKIPRKVINAHAEISIP